MKITDIVNNRRLLIIVFLTVCAVKALYSVLYVHETGAMLTVRILSFLVYTLIGYFAYKDKFIPLVVIAVITVMTGLGSLVVALFTGKDQIIFRAVSFFVGVYFLNGGIRILTKARVLSRGKTGGTP